MYYRFYRRRHTIYLAAAIVTVLFLLMRQSETNLPSDGDENSGSKEKGSLLGVRDRELVAKPRISIETYQVPKPCHGCPGENGAGVSLTVS